jgi:hypothetical protein
MTERGPTPTIEEHAVKKLLGFAALLLPIALAGCSHPQPAPYYPPPPPPPSWSEIARQGFNTGIAAARKDMRAGLPPDVNRHPRYRNPPVPPPAFEDYRHGFRDGYHEVYQHGGPPPPGN